MFWNTMIVAEVCKLLMGRSTITWGECYDKGFTQMINLHKFQEFMQSNVKRDTIMKTRGLPIIKNNYLMISVISHGVDIWASNTDPIYHNIYLLNDAALPTNTQFTERGVKDSDFVSLGRQGETNRSILTIARVKYIPEALHVDRSKINKRTVIWK